MNSSVFFRTVGYVTLVVAGALLLLFVMNVRSRIYYHGQNYGFLFWMFLFCAITGLGVVRLRKWRVILLLFPGILDAALVLYVCGTSKQSPLPAWAFFNIAFAAILLGTPVPMLRRWGELSWRL